MMSVIRNDVYYLSYISRFLYFGAYVTYEICAKCITLIMRFYSECYLTNAIGKRGNYED